MDDTSDTDTAEDDETADAADGDPAAEDASGANAPAEDASGAQAVDPSRESGDGDEDEASGEAAPVAAAAAKAGAASAPEPKAEAEAEADEKSEPEGEPKAKSEVEPAAGAEAAAEAKPAPAAEAETAAKAEPESATKAKPAPAPATPAKPEPEPEPEPKPAPASKSEADAEPERAPEPASKAKPAEPPAPAAPSAPAEPPRVERTKQQPLPPDPAEPLKLLAELTNTPPPPPTLARTLVRRVKIWTPLVVLLAIVFCVVQAVRPLPTPTLSLTAAPSYTFSGGTLTPPWPGQGQAAVEVQGLGAVGTYGDQTPAPTASMAKTMTAYLVLRDHPLAKGANGPTIPIDAEAAQQAKNVDESTVPVQKGQTYTERQMLEMLMIPSGNNIARLLGRWDAGTDDAFVKKMNSAAQQLGMTRTTYTDPSGLEATTKSTATDQLKVAAAAMGIQAFRDVVSIPNIQIPNVGRIFNNNNLLVNPGVVGIKTGSSTPAGGNLMWAAEKNVNGRTQLILGVVMGQQSGTTVDASLQKALQASDKLITTMQSTLESATVVKKGEVVGYVDNGLGGKDPVVAAADLQAIGWPGMKARLSLSVDGKKVPHQAAAGTDVGTLSFGSGTAKTQVPVALQSAMSAPGFGDKLTRLG
ncbi:D-alanyl-D-alanine carboxypeptidase [Streptomyces sp. ICBB 8177]|uniref:D-alanyl-D-alanine carboxypeptidase n=1 Tax=Streptomyces sp. ICBB 8177 TaxID=563922 RepID=UPI00316AED18